VTESQETVEIGKKKPAKKDYFIGGLSLAITILACLAVVYYWEFISQVKHYGYVGVFIISILAGGTVLVPIPGLLVVFTIASILNPAIVGALAGLGEAVGSIGIYLAGYGGRRVFQNTNHGLYARLSGWLQRHGSLAVFVNSAIFNPLFYPFTAIAGMLRFGLIKFFLLCWAGKTIKGMVVAYAGYLGLRSILRWLGLPV